MLVSLGLDTINSIFGLPGRTPSHLTFLERQPKQAIFIFSLLVLLDIIRDDLNVLVQQMLKHAKLGGC
jgi:hypothetical protein